MMDPVSIVLMISAFLTSHATGVAIAGAAGAAYVAGKKDLVNKGVDAAKSVVGK